MPERRRLQRTRRHHAARAARAGGVLASDAQHESIRGVCRRVPVFASRCPGARALLSRRPVQGLGPAPCRPGEEQRNLGEHGDRSRLAPGRAVPHRVPGSDLPGLRRGLCVPRRFLPAVRRRFQTAPGLAGHAGGRLCLFPLHARVSPQDQGPSQAAAGHEPARPRERADQVGHIVPPDSVVVQCRVRSGALARRVPRLLPGPQFCQPRLSLHSRRRELQHGAAVLGPVFGACLLLLLVLCVCMCVCCRSVVWEHTTGTGVSHPCCLSSATCHRSTTRSRCC